MLSFIGLTLLICQGRQTVDIAFGIMSAWAEHIQAILQEYMEGNNVIFKLLEAIAPL
jgi:hypothetical protein